MCETEPAVGAALEGLPGVRPFGRPEELASDWLLNSGIQLTAPPEAGGVGGWKEPGGTVPYSYGEATGYFLTYLRFLQSVSASADGLPQRMRSAFQWLSTRWAGPETPVTRRYLDGQQREDWRNGFLFSFDLAMMFRGACASPCVGAALSGPTASGLAGRLRDFVDGDGTLQCARQMRDGPVPERWSLKPGPYQMKAAAAILNVPAGVLPGRLRSAAEMTWERWLPFQPSADLGEDELHPALYFVEGLLIGFGTTGDRQQLRRASAAYRVLCSSAALERCRRSDCIAQALRSGCLLSNLGNLDRTGEARLEELAARLAAFQGPDGAVYFARSAEGRLRHANAWCSMFAAQAWWALGRLRDASATDALLRYLV